MVPCYNMWNGKMLSSPMLRCHTEVATVTPNPHTGFKAWHIPRIDLPICFQPHLAYLCHCAFDSSLCPQGFRVGASYRLLLFSIGFLLLCDFQLPCSSFIIPNALLLIPSSECKFSLITLPLLIHRVKKRHLIICHLVSLSQEIIFVAEEFSGNLVFPIAKTRVWNYLLSLE